MRPASPIDARRWLVVAALLVVAGLCRVSAMFYHEISGDDATVALMAKHVLAGEAFPAFFYRQTHMGSLNGFHLVPALAVFGPSALLVRLNAVAYSLLFPLGLYVLGRRVFDEATARVALLLAAVPPFLLTYWSTVAEPHFETNVFGVVLLLLTLAAIRAERGPRYDRALLVFGVTAGLAWWTNFKALEIILPSILVLWARDPRLPRQRGGALLAGGFVLGGAPAWIFQLAYADPGGRAAQLFETGLSLSSSWLVRRLVLLVTTVLPALLGTYYWPVDTLPRLAAVLVNVGVYAAAVAAVMLQRRRSSGHDAARPEQLWGRRLLLLVLVTAFAMVYLSAYAADFDHETSRYVLPTYIPLLLCVGALVVRLWRSSRWAGAAVLGFLLAFDVWTNLAFLWPLQPGERARRAAETKVTEAIVRHLERHPVDALYVDHEFRSLRWAFLLSVPVSETTTEIYAPGAVAADAGTRIAILAERSGGTIAAQLDHLGAIYRSTPFGRSVLHDDVRIPGRAYRVVPRGTWRLSGARDTSPPLSDGDLGTVWPPGTPGASGPGDVVIDLGASYAVGRILWWPGTEWEHTLALAVAVSPDGARWDPIGVAPSVDRRPAFVAGGRPFFRPRNGWLELRRAPTPVRYLRFAPAEPPAPETWGIAELYVYEETGPSTEASVDPVNLVTLLRARGLTRLLADPGTSARVARTTAGTIRTLTANGVLDSHGRGSTGARLADEVRVRPTDGLWVPAEDADDLRARLASARTPFGAERVGAHVLFHGLEPPVSPLPCRRTTWRLRTEPDVPDARGGRHIVETRLREVRRVVGVHVEHPAVSIRHVPLPTVAVSDDGRTWRRIDGVRRSTEWAWAGRTLFAFSRGTEELILPPTAARHLRIEMSLPYRGEHPIASVCIRAEPLP